MGGTSSHARTSMKPTGSRPSPADAPHDDVYRLDSALAGAVLQKRVNHGVRAGLPGGTG